MPGGRSTSTCHPKSTNHRYYGRFYKSMLYPLLRRINDHLVRWAMRKYKRLRRREKRARELLAEASRRSPQLFAHWRIGLKPGGWTMGAV